MLVADCSSSGSDRIAWIEVLAALFGVGAALALDEFALWLHLEDVYWSEEGKKSIDAVMLAAVFGLVLLGYTSRWGRDRHPTAGVCVIVSRLSTSGRGLPAQGQARQGLAGLPLPLFRSVRCGWPSPSRSGPAAGTARRSWPWRPKRHARYEDLLCRRRAVRDRLFAG